MNLNPKALIFWLILALIGWLAFGTVNAALAGLLIGLLICLIISFF